MNKPYCSFENTVGQRWIIPTCHIKIGLELFAPSSTKGKIFKAIFPLLVNSKISRRIMKIKLLDKRLPQTLQNKIETLFKSDNLVYSFFGGSPGKNKKTTIQISLNNVILGYCKVTEKKDVYDLFLKEVHIIDYLTSKGVLSIPQCLYCGEIDSLFVYIQNTERTLKTKHLPHIMLAWEHVNEIREKTKCLMRFETSDYFKMLNDLRIQLQHYDTGENEYIEKMISDIINEKKGKIVECVFYHGDFTPWNSFKTPKGLYFFDLEYAQLYYPPFLDLFHYYTQYALVNHKNGLWIATYYNSKIKPLFKDMNPNEYYRMYLFDIICQYLKFDYIDNKRNPMLESKIRTWIEILKFIEND